MRRRRPKAEPACIRCGNEEDLRGWGDGNTYCEACVRCDCQDKKVVNSTCLICLRRLSTLYLFDGNRIRDVTAYVKRAYYEYGIRPFELLYWTFEEEELAVALWEKYRDVSPSDSPSVAPPHHRLYGMFPP